MPKIYPQKFRTEWKGEDLFKKWLVEVPSDPSKAYCRFCKMEVAAKRSILVKHTESAKHKACIPFVPLKPDMFATASKCHNISRLEGTMSLFIACHSSINICDHLVDIVKNVPDSSTTKNINMKRSKCSAVIKNVLGPHFQRDLANDIGHSKFSLLLDESNDISVSKVLGIAVIYFSTSEKKVVHTFLALVHLEQCDAKSIVEALKKSLVDYKLKLRNLLAIGTDNASVMTGVNNGVHQILKEDVPNLLLFRCVCHSLQLAVSHAAKKHLPRNLEFLVSETYRWFSHSALRQLAYQQLYQTINAGSQPLKITNIASTRWLSIETAVSRILQQWLELKTHFQIYSTQEKCYTSQLLFEMYSDERNLLYIIFLQPVLLQVQEVNKLFESNTVDKTKLFDDLSRLIKSISRLLILPTARVDPLTSDIDDYLDLKPNLGYRYERKAAELILENKLTAVEEADIRKRAQGFLLTLFKELKSRLPENLQILSKISAFSVNNVLNQIKEPIAPVCQLLNVTDEEISLAEIQYRSIHLQQWTPAQRETTQHFWTAVYEEKDSVGGRTYKELAACAFQMLSLPHSNAEIERVFSSMNLVKSKLRNKMQLPMLNAILAIRYGLKRKNKCCQTYQLPLDVLRKIGTSLAYSSEETEAGSSTAATSAAASNVEDDSKTFEEVEALLRGVDI